MVRHFDAHLHPFQTAIESMLDRLRGTGAPGLQVDSSIHLPSQAGTVGRAPGNHRGEVHGRRGCERNHADVTEPDAHRQERTGQHDEVPGSDERRRVGTRVVDAVDRRPVGQLASASTFGTWCAVTIKLISCPRRAGMWRVLTVNLRSTPSGCFIHSS